MRKNDNFQTHVRSTSSGQRNLLRVVRRRLGLTQRELAFLLGYDSESQVSRIENGSRMPFLAEALIIELVFGVPAVRIFPQVREVVGERVGQRVKALLAGRALDSHECTSRMSYKNAQLEAVLASLRSLDDFDPGESVL
jgi:transcriptional regulator with XRE-family HTH domain